MKTLILVALLSSSVLAYAKDIVLTVPDNLFPAETSYSANFDGSVNIKKPKLFVDGSYKFINPVNWNNTYDTPYGSAEGICSLLKKKFVNFTSTSFDPLQDSIVLKPDGTLDKVDKYIGQGTFLELVTCK